MIGAILAKIDPACAFSVALTHCYTNCFNPNYCCSPESFVRISLKVYNIPPGRDSFSDINKLRWVQSIFMTFWSRQERITITILLSELKRNPPHKFKVAALARKHNKERLNKNLRTILLIIIFSVAVVVAITM